jgi:hypothetical protein
MTAKIFLAQAQVRPLDPVVVSSSPAHAATNVSPVAPVVLHFSQPMNTNSVQAAFATKPAVSGRFAWSENNTALTFTPAGAGFAPLTNLSVMVSNTALDAVVGNPLTAPYQLMFQTTAAPPLVYFSSPAADGTVVPLASNTTYLIQICFTPNLDTNDPSLFQLNINGTAQPPSAFIFRPVGAVAGCTGMRSLFYNWSSASPGTLKGTNLLQIIYSNTLTGVVLTDTHTVIVPPLLVASGLVGHYPTVVWSSTPGVNYQVLATTNLALPFTAVSGVVPATGLSTSYLDVSNSPPAPQKFYEVEVVP